MAKLYTEEFFKATVENFMFYRLKNMMIVRTASGFTKETRRNDPKYQNCTRSANEFGRVSSLCKQVRIALADILPKQNNLAVVNSFTKKMRAVLEYDTSNARGERQLANALATSAGRQQLKGYEFNPDTTIAFDYVLTENAITVNTKNIILPKGAKHIGFRVHQFAFDFATAATELVSGEWDIESKTVTLDLPILSGVTGVLFTILEAQFYDYVNREFVPMIEDGGKRVLVVGVE